MGETSLFVALALMTGLAIAVQTGVNTQLRTSIGSALAATFISFLVGTALLAAAVVGSRTELPLARLARMSWWMWMGGVLGVFIVSTNIVVAPRLGAALLLSLAIAGQLSAALVLDHYGAFGFPVHPISVGRVMGALLLVGGVILVRYA
jgi:bacterial/archaeal transporter family-2 protein